MTRLCVPLLAVMLTGCASLGPKSVAVDRFDYSSAIADSWKQQALLNRWTGGVYRPAHDRLRTHDRREVPARTHHPDRTAQHLLKAATVRRLLKLPESQHRFVLAYSPMRGAENELAVNSRSLLQILQAFASYVEVPEQHVAEKRAAPAFENTAGGQREVGRIRSGKQRPEQAYVAVPYRGYWFWVDDADWEAERALTAVMFFFTLADTGNEERLPLVTIPAQ